MNLGIRDHIAIVTGGGRGIGEAVSIALGSEGCKVAIWDRDLDCAESVAMKIREAGGTAIAVAVDVSQRQSVIAAMKEVVDQYGTAHILVNNAGCWKDASVLEMTEDQWDDVIDACLKGTFLCTQVAAKAMVKQRYGRIINITSRSHLGGDPNKTNYAAAKGGIVSFTRAASIDLGAYNITVNAVAPGITSTDRITDSAEYVALEQRALAVQPIKRIATPEDQARGVLFLAAADAGQITGETIHITAGRY